MSEGNNDTPFGLPTGRITISSLDEKGSRDYTVSAQYNPKELEIKRTVPWSKKDESNKANAKDKQDQGIHMEFTGAEGRTMTVELIFDGYEPQAGDGYYIENVMDEVAKLEKLASVRDPNKKQEEFRRPHRCMVVWGPTFGSEGFSCVIDSLTTKYTMFDGDGKPLRATCTVSLKEANVVSRAKKK